MKRILIVGTGFSGVSTDIVDVQLIKKVKA